MKGFIGSVAAIRSGMMKGIEESGLASASSMSGKGLVSLISKVRSPMGTYSAATLASNCPIGSRTAQRLIDAMQSVLRTGVLSWKRRPSRRRMRQVRPFGATSWPSAICGWG